MAITRNSLLFRGSIWTVGVFGVNQSIRVATSVVLARLLAPELFGLMQIFYSLRDGIELISDVGISQNLIYNKNANEPDFYNTAWTIQLIRGIVLWLVFCALAAPLANFYQSSTLAYIAPVAAFALVLSGFSSTSHSLIRKRMRYKRLAIFDLTNVFIFAIVQIILAFLSPTIWALVFGSLAGTIVSVIGTHFLLPDVRHRLFVAKAYAVQILSFGKWIFASSIIYFMSTNFDRLYLAKVIPLEVLGIYGIARSLAAVLTGAVQQLSYNIIFPFVSSHAHMPRGELHDRLSPIRMQFLLVSSVGFSIFAVTADLVVKVLYDQRYHAVSWMVSVLIIGAWFAIMSSLNESTLLGLGRPNYSVFANCGRFGLLLVGLPLSVTHFGVAGGILVVAASDFCRYIPILMGQFRERFSFARQDILATLIVVILITLLEWLRWAVGFGTSFDAFPIDFVAMF